MICNAETPQFKLMEKYQKKTKCLPPNNWSLIINPATHQNDLHLYWSWEGNKNINPLIISRWNRDVKFNFQCQMEKSCIFTISMGQYSSGMRCKKHEDIGGSSRKERYCIKFFEMLYSETAEKQKNFADIGKVDGYFPERNLIIEYHGCYYHGCGCQKTRNIQAYRETIKRDQKIRDSGFELHSIWECSFDTYLNDHKEAHIALLHGLSIEFNISDLIVPVLDMNMIDASTQTEIELTSVVEEIPNWIDTSVIIDVDEPLVANSKEVQIDCCIIL